LKSIIKPFTSFTGRELKTEFVRKALHLLIALVPSLVALDRSCTALLLMGGVLFYTLMESLRFLGFSPPIVSAATVVASRKREQEKFVLGPVTLGLGALLTLLLFPPQAAAAAIYALAFGDTASSLIGKFLGRFRPPFLNGKSIEGSLACLAVSTLTAFLVFREWEAALAAGIAATVFDALPLGDFDNILIPLAAGLMVYLVKY